MLLAPLFTLAAQPPGGGDVELIAPPSEYNLERFAVKREVEALTSNLAGESISLADGSLSFTVTDLSIKTNSQIPLNITRTYNRLTGKNDKSPAQFGDWELELPKIEATYLKGSTRYSNNYYSSTACSSALSPGPISFYGDVYEQHEYWNGADVIIPGASGKLLSGSGQHRYRTKLNASINCSSENGNEYFIVKTSEGLIYTLGHRIEKLGLPLVKTKPAQRSKLAYVATKVEDKFGNTLHYIFDGSKLEKITYQPSGSAHSEDLVSFSYESSGRINKITSQERVWEYLYEEKYANQNHNLTDVILPTGQSWEYDFPEFINYASKIYVKPNFNVESCIYSHTTPLYGPESSLKVKHPNGANISFNYKLTVHGRTEVPAKSQRHTRQGKPINYNACYANLAISSKSIDINDEQYVWTYAYSNNYSHFNSAGLSSSEVSSFRRGIAIIGNTKEVTCNTKSDCSSIPSGLGLSAYDLRVLKVTAPNNSYINSYISKRWDETEGQVIAQVEHGPNGEINQKTLTQYWKSSFKGNSGIVDPILTTNTDTLSYIVKDKRVTKHVNSDSFTKSYIYNIYDAPEQVVLAGPSGTFYKKQFYQHDTLNWILNLPTITQVSSDDQNYIETKRIQYNAFSNSYFSNQQLPSKVYLFGQLQRTFTDYTAQGNVERIEFNSNRSVGTGKRFIEYANYKRGLPQVITVPNRSTTGSMSAGRVVDNNGWVTRTTDYNGVSTNYTYDDMGRIKSVDLTNDAVNGSWYDTLYTWHNDTNTRTASTCTLDSSRTACTGNAVFKTTEYYDNLLRLTKTKSQDLVNSSAANSTRYQRFEYNYLNQPTFQSYASANISENKGTTTVYDSLGRQQSVTTSGLGTVNYAYLSGNRIEVTDAKGHVTTTTYQAFGSPSYSRAIKIESPENVTTTLDIDIFGLTHSITQAGANQYGNSTSVTERRYYDNSKQLCLTTRPDVGNTLYKHNVIGELIWSQGGVANTQCTSTAPSGSTFYTYENLGSLKQVNYPDASGDVSYERDNNGNVKTLTAGNVIHRYEYNNQNRLEEEQLFVGNELPLMLNYKYNALQQREQLGYPDGTIVNFKPNGFGEPTEAQVYKSGNVDLSFAKSASYYANGTLSSFTYGNGVKHQTTLYADSLLPKQLKDTGPAGSNIPSTVMALTYDYDKNANVTSIIDSQNSAYSLTNLQYDDLDRLTSTTGAAGIGSSEMHYDGLGNITYYKNKNKTLNYTYDYAKNRLSKVTGVSGRYGSIGYDTRGNITNNGAYSLDFNVANQLTTAKGNSYLYDGHNRRVKQSDGNGTSYSMYSQDGTLLYREKGETITGNGTNYIYLGKKLIAKYGDVTPQTVNASRQHSRPFGESIEAPKDDVGYTGHKFDTDLGLSYMQARYYDPVIGRFYSNDPIGFTGDITTFNRYSYVGNNPYKYTDPNGQTRWNINAGIKIVGTIGGAVNLGFSFDDQSFEFSITAGGSGRYGVEAGTDLSFSTEPSSTKGNSAELKGTIDLSLGTGEETVKVEGEYSTATGFDAKPSLQSAIKVDANGVNLSPSLGGSIGAGAQGTVNISIPDTLNNISNAVSSAINSVSEAANQCAANPGTSC